MEPYNISFFVRAIIIGVCDPNPCFNGGVCSVSHEGKFNCTCPAGFGGDKCEISE